MRKAKIIFFSISGLYLLSILLEIQILLLVLKPLIISCLLLYYILNERRKISGLLVTALLFSISGDFWLMFSGEDFFMAGLGSFLITQLLYILLFKKLGAFKKIKPTLAIIFIALLVTLLFYLWNDLGHLKLPVSVYACIIITMGYSASAVKNEIKKEAFNYLSIGTKLFILSDSLIALNKFKANELEIPFVHFLIMSTYILGQYLIVEGFLKTTNSQNI